MMITLPSLHPDPRSVKKHLPVFIVPIRWELLLDILGLRQIIVEAAEISP